jgi:branched-chain amino acid transport system substrate-binding protein
MLSAAPLFLLAGLSACTGESADPKNGGTPKAEVKEIVIGEFGSLTGPEATFGISTKNGIELATEEINAKGGIAGMKIRVVVEDEQGKPEETATAVSKLINRDRPVALLGEVASSLSLKAAPLAQNAGIPMISPSSTNPKVTEQGDYIFRVCFIDPFQGTAVAKFAYNTKSARKVAILKDLGSDYSKGLSQFFTDTFTKLGGSIATEETYTKGDLDFKAQLTKIIATNPDAIFIPGYYTDVGLIAQQARQMNFKGILLGGDGWDSSKLVEVGGQAVVGGFFTNHYSTDDPNPLVQDFVKKYQAKYGELPDGLAALGYDAAQVLYSAMAEIAKDPAIAEGLGDRSSVPATKDKRDAARKALRDQLARVAGFQGVTGAITIDASRNAQKPAVVVEVLSDPGKYRFVESVSPEGSAPPGGPSGELPPPPEGGPPPGAPEGGPPPGGPAGGPPGGPPAGGPAGGPPGGPPSGPPGGPPAGAPPKPSSH